MTRTLATAALLVLLVGCSTESTPTSAADSGAAVQDSGADASPTTDGAPSLGPCEKLFELWITQQASAGTSTPCQACLNSSCAVSCNAWSAAGTPAPSDSQLACLRSSCDSPSCFTEPLADALQCMITSCGSECYAPDFDHCEHDASSE